MVHIHKYVEEQNQEKSVEARVFKSQQETTAQSGFKVRCHVRLFFINIKAGAFNFFIPQRLYHCFFINHGSTRRINQIGGQFHKLELFGAHQASGIRCQQNMNRNKVRRFQQGFKIDKLCPTACSASASFPGPALNFSQ